MRHLTKSVTKCAHRRSSVKLSDSTLPPVGNAVWQQPNRRLITEVIFSDFCSNRWISIHRKHLYYRGFCEAFYAASNNTFPSDIIIQIWCFSAPEFSLFLWIPFSKNLHDACFVNAHITHIICGFCFISLAHYKFSQGYSTWLGSCFHYICVLHSLYTSVTTGLESNSSSKWPVVHTSNLKFRRPLCTQCSDPFASSNWKAR